MIRPFTLITAIMFVLSGAYLFAVKHRSEMLDSEIAATAQATRLDEQRIRVLQAQWALEVDPSRLAQLSAKFTQLQPMKPGQLVTLSALQGALPPAGSAVPGEAPAAPAITEVAAVQPVAAPAPAKPVQKPVQMASVAVPRVTHVARTRPAPVMREARLDNVETLLRNLPAHAAHVRHPALGREYAENRPAYAAPSALAAASVAMPPPMMEARVVPVRAVAQASAAPMDGGSMLGMAQDMAGGSAN